MQLKIPVEGTVEEKVKILRSLSALLSIAGMEANYKAELIRRQALGREHAKKKRQRGEK